MRAKKTGSILTSAFTSSTFSSENRPPYVTLAPSSRVGLGLVEEHGLLQRKKAMICTYFFTNLSWSGFLRSDCSLIQREGTALDSNLCHRDMMNSIATYERDRRGGSKRKMRDNITD